MFLKEDQYQHGLLCFRDHGVRNLTTSHLTRRSVSVLWSLHAWDVQEDLIKDTAIFLYQYAGDAGEMGEEDEGDGREKGEQRDKKGKGDETMVLRRRINVRKNNHLRQVYTIRWLTPCTKYKLFVVASYYSIGSREKRNSSITFRTKCADQQWSDASALVFTTLELVLVNVCIVVVVLFFVAGLVQSIYVLPQSSGRPTFFLRIN